MASGGQPAMRDAGITVLELVVVLAILSLAAGLTMPRVSAGLKSLRLKATATQLASEFKFARAAALKSNTEQIVAVDGGARRFWRVPGGRPKAISSDISVVIEMAPPGFAGALAQFRFRPDGSASGGSLNLASGAAGARLSVDWLTGNVRVEWR